MKKQSSIGFFAIIMLAVSLFFTSCGSKPQQVEIDPNSIVSYGPGDSITETLHFTKAVPFEKTYKGCDGSQKISKRNAAVDTTINFSYVAQGERNDMAAMFAANGWKIVSDNSNSAVKTAPVDPSNGNDDNSSTKKSDGGGGLFSSFKFWDFGPLINFIIAMCLLAIAILIGMLIWHLLQRAWAALKGSDSNGGGNRNIVTDEQPVNLTRRSGGYGRHAPLQNVRRTTITETRTTVHEY